MNQKDGRADRSFSQTLSCDRIKDVEGKKRKPVREESFSSKLVFQRNDFSYIDKIVDPNRKKRDGPKGYPPSSIFLALLLMYLKSMESILDLIRFLNSNPDWLVTLSLKRKIDGKLCYKVPDRSTFYKFANRLESRQDSRNLLRHGNRANPKEDNQGRQGLFRLLDHKSVVLRL